MRCKYYCDYCGMAFDTADECKRHEIVELAEKEKERRRKTIAAAKTKIAKLAQDESVSDDAFLEELDKLTKDMLNSAEIKHTATTPIDSVKDIFTADKKIPSLSYDGQLDSLSSSISRIVNEFQNRIENRAKASSDEKKDAKSDSDCKPKVTTTYWVNGEEVDKDTFRKASLEFGSDDGIADITDITEAIRDLF